ncbi:hypothetical protein FV288_18005 [Escherichia coli]|nr:hypothetical protein FV288_18005 [Escherichia coli]
MAPLPQCPAYLLCVITECNKRDGHQGIFCYYSRWVAFYTWSLFLRFMKKIKLCIDIYRK